MKRNDLEKLILTALEGHLSKRNCRLAVSLVAEALIPSVDEWRLERAIARRKAKQLEVKYTPKMALQARVHELEAAVEHYRKSAEHAAGLVAVAIEQRKPVNAWTLPAFAGYSGNVTARFQQ
jgi:hypothetical protein